MHSLKEAMNDEETRMDGTPVRGVSDLVEEIIEALTQPDEKGILRGDWVCHSDIPDIPPPGIDAAFTVCGENPERETFVISITRIET